MKKNRFFRVENIIVIAVVLFTSILSISFAALVQNLSISGEVTVKPDVIKITGVELVEATGSAAESSGPTFALNTVTTVVNYPNTTSEITYDVTIKNETREAKKISGIMLDCADDMPILAKMNFEVLEVSGDTDYRLVEQPIAVDATVKVRMKLKYTETYKDDFTALGTKTLTVNFTFDNQGENRDHFMSFYDTEMGTFVNGCCSPAGLKTNATLEGTVE